MRFKIGCLCLIEYGVRNKSKCPKIAPRIGLDSSCGKARMVVLCKPRRNGEAQAIRKQDRMTIPFRGPNLG